MSTAKTDTKTGTATRPMKLTINGKSCTGQKGETVLDVARRAGIDIPALCQMEGSAPWGACRLCLVEVEGIDKLQAACTTFVAEGLKVKTDSERIRAKRESYLRMYLSDHNAYCEAPCSHACPTHIDIPGYLAALAAGDAAGAASIVRAELPFPGILGRICPRYCEPVCRRGEVDEPIAICALHRALADHGPTPAAHAPRPVSSSGKRVAVVGAGPAGLSAAWFLTERGHQVTVYDAEAKAGGLLRYAIPEFRLPEIGPRPGAAAPMGGRRPLRGPVQVRRLRVAGGPAGHGLRRRGGRHRQRHHRAAKSPADAADDGRRLRARRSGLLAQGAHAQAHAPRRQGGGDRRQPHRPRRRPHRSAPGGHRRHRRHQVRRRHPARRRPRARRRDRRGRQVHLRRRRPGREGRRQGRDPHIAKDEAGAKKLEADRFTGRTATPGSSWPATRSPARTPPSTPSPAASAPRWPSMPGCAAATLPSWNRNWPPTPPCPT